MKIPLTQNKFALVDDDDFEKVNSIKWYFEHGYARSDVGRKRLYMHRFILGVKDKKVVDHKNGDGLDNRKENLRAGNQSLNMANQKLSSANTSGYKGVGWHKTLKYWTSTLKVNGKGHVKYSKNIKDAVRKYNEMAINFFGDYALLNKL